MSCTYCYKGFALPGEPKGSMVGLDYFTPAPNDAAQQSKAIILLTDVFGLPLPNPRIVADHLAEHVGVDVWVPDFFNGAFYYPIHTLWRLPVISKRTPSGKPLCDANDMEPLMPDRAGVKISWLTYGLFFAKALPYLPRFIANRPSVVDARVQEAWSPYPVVFSLR